MTARSASVAHDVCNAAQQLISNTQASLLVGLKCRAWRSGSRTVFPHSNQIQAAQSVTKACKPCHRKVGRRGCSCPCPLQWCPKQHQLRRQHSFYLMHLAHSDSHFADCHMALALVLFRQACECPSTLTSSTHALGSQGVQASASITTF